jgi:hypothetical protein
MNERRLAFFLGISGLVHLVLLMLIFSPWFQSLRIRPDPVPPEPLTLTLIQLPPPPPAVPATPPKPTPAQRPFIDTTDLARAEKPDPDALFQSDANTRAASRATGSGDPRLAQQTSEEARREFSLRDSTFSPEQPGQVASPAPNPKQDPTPPQPPKPPTPPVETTAQKPPQPNPNNQDLKLRDGSGIALGPKPETAAKPPTPPVPPSPETSNPSESRAPPATFTADRRRSAISGGAPLGPESSVASQETELGRYKQKLYRAVGSRWYFDVQRQMSLLRVGSVRIRFFVRSNGVIEKPEFIEGDSQTVLAGISLNSILKIGAMEPFSDQMKQQLGDGFWEEISFSIY